MIKGYLLILYFLPLVNGRFLCPAETQLRYSVTLEHFLH